ncbi:hypothetical protein [Allohahella marinimesophila]|uniref:PIN domain-containing protein n=1 Tax=Allohahella marinimesophila TaxID=1054972 RepID=A0ABP7Q9V6_9GAMM
MADAVKRCTVIIPDAGPLISLWVADQLSLLLKLDMRIVVIDAIYAELTRDPDNWPKDKAIKNFIQSNQPPFVIEPTRIGRAEKERTRKGERPLRNACEIAIADFMSAEDGLGKYISSKEPVVVLWEDSDTPFMWFSHKLPNLHLLTTVGFLRGLERVSVIPCADAVIREMTHPSITN